MLTYDGESYSLDASARRLYNRIDHWLPSCITVDPPRFCQFEDAMEYRFRINLFSMAVITPDALGSPEGLGECRRSALDLAEGAISQLQAFLALQQTDGKKP